MTDVNLIVMKHRNGAYVVGLNDRLIKGTFPNSASPIMETTVPMETIADAFSVKELEQMLKYRRGDKPDADV